MPTPDLNAGFDAEIAKIHSYGFEPSITERLVQQVEDSRAFEARQDEWMSGQRALVADGRAALSGGPGMQMPDSTPEMDDIGRQLRASGDMSTELEAMPSYRQQMDQTMDGLYGPDGKLLYGRPNPAAALEESISTARSLGLPEEQILKSNADIDDFMLRGAHPPAVQTAVHPPAPHPGAGFADDAARMAGGEVDDVARQAAGVPLGKALAIGAGAGLAYYGGSRLYDDFKNRRQDAQAKMASFGIGEADLLAKEAISLGAVRGIAGAAAPAETQILQQGARRVINAGAFDAAGQAGQAGRAGMSQIQGAFPGHPNVRDRLLSQFGIEAGPAGVAAAAPRAQGAVAASANTNGISMNGMMLSPGGLPFKTASIFTDSLAVTRQRMAAIPGRIMRKGKEVAADVTIAGQDAASAIGTELKDVGSGNVPWTQARRAERAALKEEKRRTSYMRNLGHGLFGAGIVGGTAYIASRTPDTPDPYAGMPTNTYRGA